MIKFEKRIDPLVSLGIGKKALITKWLDEMGITDYIINDDYTIDVEGYVYLDDKGLDKFPDYIKFSKVGGNFSCSDNHLVSLEGCPVSVGGDFYCSNNQLVSLEGCPVSVGGDFSCSYNQLVSLEGCPVSVGGSFYCGGNKKQFNKEEVKKVCKVTGIIVI